MHEPPSLWVRSPSERRTCAPTPSARLMARHAEHLSAEIGETKLANMKAQRDAQQITDCLLRCINRRRDR